MANKGIGALLIGIVELIILIVLLAGVTPAVLDALNNLSSSLVNNGLAIGSLLAVQSLGGLLWFLLVILIIIGAIFLMVRKAGGSK